ncbi:GumC family protein [Geobacter sulfurreducens]|uniref:GumC family protein n=1 Tax=Geobacter sulfurreducens TaxID=35554 RepID=UPI0001D8F1B9|nr:Wzz/FepE/Etk N-terminal domain-containing protein [Geobacter sulfurreducens]ADI84694.1 polysaccharide chain length determinant protein [Geobacter sulfurreducens KN400]
MSSPPLIPPSESDPNGSRKLVDYFEVITRNRLIVFRITVLSALVSIVVSLLLPKIYYSTARILPPQQENGIFSLMLGQMGGGVANLASDILGSGSTSDLYASILKSEAIKDRVIDRFKLIEVYKKSYRLDTYKTLDETVSVDVGKKDGIISITVEDKDPKRAAAIANAYVEELGALTRGLNTTGASQQRKFLEERLIKAKADLASTEDALKNFQSKNKAIDITEQAKGSIQEIADITGRLALEEVKLSTLQQQFTDASHEVVTQKKVIATLRSQLARKEGQEPQGVLPSIGSVPAIGEQYVRLMREFKIQEALVELLTKQFELMRYNEANTISTVQVIQKATVPDKKTKPKRSLLVMASTITGALFSIVYVFFINYSTQLPLEDRRRWRNVISGLISRKFTV